MVAANQMMLAVNQMTVAVEAMLMLLGLTRSMQPFGPQVIHGCWLGQRLQPPLLCGGVLLGRQGAEKIDSLGKSGFAAGSLLTLRPNIFLFIQPSSPSFRP